MIQFVCMYRFPSLSNEEDRQLIRSLKGVLAGLDKVLIEGDFNLPYINWEIETCLTVTREEEILGWLHGIATHQHAKRNTVHRAACTPSLMDLLITKQEGI